MLGCNHTGIWRIEGRACTMRMSGEIREVEAHWQNGVDGDETEMNGLREQGMHVADGDWVSRMAMAKATQRRWIDIREKAER